MDITQLIADLQEISQKNRISHYKRDRCAAAATALSTLQGDLEIAKSSKVIGSDQLLDELQAIQTENAQLRAELEQVKAERDAAIDCINQIQSARDHTRPAYVVDSILHNWKSRK